MNNHIILKDTYLDRIEVNKPLISFQLCLGNPYQNHL